MSFKHLFLLCLFMLSLAIFASLREAQAFSLAKMLVRQGLMAFIQLIHRSCDSVLLSACGHAQADHEGLTKIEQIPKLEPSQSPACAREADRHVRE